MIDITYCLYYGTASHMKFIWFLMWICKTCWINEAIWFITVRYTGFNFYSLFVFKCVYIDFSLYTIRSTDGLKKIQPTFNPLWPGFKKVHCRECDSSAEVTAVKSNLGYCIECRIRFTSHPRSNLSSGKNQWNVSKGFTI